MSQRVATPAKAEVASVVPAVAIAVADQLPPIMTIDEITKKELESEGVGLTEFTLFPKLPLETRLQIWAFAAPEPAYVIQVESRKVGRRFHYIREIPAVLHACRESRIEYLETNDLNDTTLERRRKAHPVYKAHFAERSTRNGSRGCFMSAEIDTMCGFRYSYHRMVVWDTVHAIADLKATSIAGTLTHLAVTYGHIHKNLIKAMMNKFPALQDLTVILPDSPDEYNDRGFGKNLYLKEEIDGRVDLEGIGAVPGDFRVARWIQFRDMTTAMLQQMASEFPGKRFPALKCRFLKQVMKNDRLTLPPLPPDDPLKEMDKEMQSIDRRRNLEKMRKKLEKSKPA